MPRRHSHSSSLLAEAQFGLSVQVPQWMWYFPNTRGWTCIYFIFLAMWLVRSLFPDQGLNLGHSSESEGVVTTGLPGNSPWVCFNQPRKFYLPSQWLISFRSMTQSWSMVLWGWSGWQTVGALLKKVFSSGWNAHSFSQMLWNFYGDA